MTPRQIRAYCDLSTDCERLLERAITQQGLSARAHDRILKVSRTVADLEGVPHIEPTPRRFSTGRWIGRIGRDCKPPTNREVAALRTLAAGCGCRPARLVPSFDCTSLRFSTGSECLYQRRHCLR